MKRYTIQILRERENGKEVRRYSDTKQERDMNEVFFLHDKECKREMRKKALEILWNSIHSFLHCVTEV